MNDLTYSLLQLMFLLGFTLHNLEEAIWLPQWSKQVKTFRREVGKNEFIFAVIAITLLGYGITILDFIFGGQSSLFTYLFLGFAGMMGLNAIFPHAWITIRERKYAPGLMTGLFSNLPISIILMIYHIKQGINPLFLAGAVIAISLLAVLFLPILFKAGKRWVTYD